MGLQLYDIKYFVQYARFKALAPFVDKVYHMRLEATYEKDDAKECFTYTIFYTSIHRNSDIVYN